MGERKQKLNRRFISEGAPQIIDLCNKLMKATDEGSIQALTDEIYRAAWTLDNESDVNIRARRRLAPKSKLETWYHKNAMRLARSPR